MCLNFVFIDTIVSLLSESRIKRMKGFRGIDSIQTESV